MMHPRTPHSLRTIGPVLAATLAALAGSCASKPGGAPATAETVPQTVDDPNVPHALQAFRQSLASAKPQAKKNLPPPPGIDSARLKPLTEAELASSPTARRTLTEITPELAAKVSLPKAADAEPSEEDKAEAVRLYIAGRSALLAGDASQAQALLTDAAGKDPAEAAVWRELAEAQYKLGRRTLAISSYTQAARRGLDEARVWWMLGRDSLQKSDLARAAAYLAKAEAAPDIESDAGLPFVIDADFGEALAQLGYFTAAAEALSSSAELPETFTENTNFRAELGEVYRRRGELLEQAGDLQMRLGQSGAALESYAAATEFPSIDPGATLVRFIYASSLQGDPTRAGEFLLERIIEADGWIEDRQLLLIRYLAENTQAGPALARGLLVLPKDLKTPATPTLQSRIVRARAAADPSGAAILRDYLASNPWDSDAVADYFSAVARANGDLAREALRLAEANPSSAVRIADALTHESAKLDAVAKSIASGARTPGQRAMASWLLSRIGQTAKAQELAASIDPAKETDPDARAVLLGVQLHAALDAGEFAFARQVLAELKTDDRLPFATRAGALLDGGEDALVESLAKSLDVATLPRQSGERIAAGEIIARFGRAKDAESIFEEAVTADRFDERAYQSLLALYLPKGPLKDETKLGATSRRLREAIPSSRVIRWLVAGELAQRQLWSQAETSLISIAEEGEPDPVLIDQLLVAWERQAAGDAETRAATLARADAWLQTKMKQFPGSLVLAAAHARVLELSGKPEEAEKLLSALVARYPMDALERQREKILAGPLKQPELARELADARLGHLPRSVDASLELAEMWAEADDASKVADAIKAGIPKGAPLNALQRQRLLALLNQQVSAAIKNESAATAAPVLDLLAHSLALGLDLPKPLHEARLALLASQFPDRTQELAEAALLAGKLYPDGSTLLLARTADRLSKSAKPDAAPKFLMAAVRQVNEPTSELYRFLGYYLIPRFGGIDDVRAFAELLDSSGKPVIIADLAAGGDSELPAAQADRINQILHNVASSATLQDRAEFSMEIYRFVLARDPRHAMSCNNLAYYLLDHGGDLSEAERLLTIAFAEKSDTASVLDSMGWLRYRQGRMRDAKDASGNISEPGAVSLLTRALEARDASENAVIADHLGDALWAAGEKQKAKEHWELARVSARRLIDQIMALRQANPGESENAYKVELAELRGVSTQTDLKLKALAEGKEPPVAQHQPISR